MINKFMDNERHFFCATSGYYEHQTAYFSLKFSPFSSENNFQCDVEIEYLGILQEDEQEFKRIGNRSYQINKWTINTNYSKMFNNSIMVNNSYRSFGIGSFVFNLLIQEAIQHAPNKPLILQLSTIDETGDNKVRRNKMYEQVGLLPMENYQMGIDKIGMLKPSEVFQNITETTPRLILDDLFGKLEEISYSLSDAKNANLANKETAYDFYTLKHKYIRTRNWLIAAVVLLTVVLFECFSH